MDVLSRATTNIILGYLRGLAILDAGLEEEATSHKHTSDTGFQEEAISHTHTPQETKRRERKRHIPSVTTVSRAAHPESDGRQARRTSVTVLEEEDETIEANAIQNRDTPNTADNARPDSPARQGHGRVSVPNMVESRSSIQEATSISGSVPNRAQMRSSTQEVFKPSTTHHTALVEAKQTTPSVNRNPQVSPTPNYQNFEPNPLYCHRCHRRHNPRPCRGKGRSY